jgi:hypothetical protein
MTDLRTRLAGWALIVGSTVAAFGYLAANVLAGGSGDSKYTHAGWPPLYGVALAGNLVVLLGLPAILTVHGRRAQRLTLVGYAGTFAALVMLNVSEGTLEAFVKPYLVRHGGIPDSVTGWTVWESVALLCMLIGLGCLGTAVIRARVLPTWVGVLLLVSPVVAFLGLPGALTVLSDDLLFVALVTVGLHVLRAPSRHQLSPAWQTASTLLPSGSRTNAPK